VRLSRQAELNVNTEKYFLRPVITDVTYRVQILAYNEVGDGPRSDVISVGRWPNSILAFAVVQFALPFDMFCFVPFLFAWGTQTFFVQLLLSCVIQVIKYYY